MVRFLLKRPVATLMTSLGILVLGILAVGYVPISLMPDIDIPEITVQVDGGNMSARELEDAIVRPLRSSLLQVAHLEDIKSETTNGASIIRLQFTHGTPVHFSFIEVNEKVDRAMANLPRELERPRVIKASATDIPVLYINLTLLNETTLNIDGEVSQEFVDFNRFANQVIRKRIEQIPEVAMVDISGLVFPEILIVPDENKLIALGLGLGDLESAIQKEDHEIGSILLKDNQYQYNIRLGNTLTDINDLKNIQINTKDRIIQLKDLATISEQSQKRTGLVLSDGKEAVIMAIIKQSDARMDNLKEALYTTIEQMEKEYPEIDLHMTRDQTRLLDQSITNLGQSLFWGVLLAFMLMFLFLKDIISPVLIGINVPASLILCLLFFQLFGISINIISLSGLVLGTGLMIDNSIIVIDNIAQHRERGLFLFEACVKGVNEVSKPLLSSVLTTCAVFVPLIFLSGITGALFYDQAMAISIGLFTSLLVSITLLPVLYHLFHIKRGRFHKIGRFVEKLNPFQYERWYEKGLRFTMRNQYKVFGIVILLVIITAVLFITLPKRQMPELSHTETLFTIDWNEPINVEENKRRTIQLMDSLGITVAEYTAILGEQQFLLDKNSVAKSSQGTLYLHAQSEADLKQAVNTLKVSTREKYPNAITETKDVDNIFNLIFSNDTPPLTAKIRQIENMGTVQKESLKELLEKVQNLLPNTNIAPIAWEEHIALLADTEKMMTYGVPISLLENTLKTALNEKEVFSIVDNQNFVPIVLGGTKRTISDIIEQTELRINDSTYLPVGQFIDQNRLEDLRTITAGKEGVYYPIDFSIEEKKEQETVQKIRSVVDHDSRFDVTFAGNLTKNRELIRELMLVLGVTLLLLYFILASQFESLTLPLIILLEIPLAMAGSFFFLYIFGMGIDLMSMIGIVVLSGITINDSILKIDTIIQLQREGNTLMRALLVAGQRRLKPILMTTLTTILALVPMLFTSGLGGELQAPLAVALIGGMLIGTLVSLYFIPICYYHLSKNKKHAV